MNWSYYSIRRLRGALILILLGVVFFLQETDWFHFDVWPLFFIGLGVILLAERMLPAPAPPPYPYGYQQPGTYPPGTYPPTYPPGTAAPVSDHPPASSTALTGPSSTGNVSDWRS